MKRYLSDEERSNMFSRLAVAIVAFGFLYVAASIGVMAHLVHENNQMCVYRQDAISAARQYVIMADPDFTIQDRALLDELFPEPEC